MQSIDEYDVFLSYARTDSGAATILVEALKARGLRVWIDTAAIEPHDPISETVQCGLARSKAFVPLYSKTYPSRRACQWELTAAFAAAQGLGDVRDRILVVNPEPEAPGIDRFAHIEPVELRDTLISLPPDADFPAWAHTLAGQIAERVASLTGVLGGATPPVATQYGRRLVGAESFVGRHPEIWQLHSALSGSDAVLVTSAAMGEVVIAVGPGGIGKSLLAEEYALRFSAAYPGGVFWLQASSGSHPVSADAQENQLDVQLRGLADEIGITSAGSNATELRGAIGLRLAGGGRALWIVDDMPAGLTDKDLRRWLSPHPNARTLLTSQSRKYGVGQQIVIDRLRPKDGYRLLTSRRKPRKDTDDDACARAIVESLGGHPLALAVSAQALRIETGPSPFADYQNAIERDAINQLELVAELGSALPNGHERSIAATLSYSIERLRQPGRDLLRVASVLAPDKIPSVLVAKTFNQAKSSDVAAGKQATAIAIDEVEGLSLLDLDSEGDGTIAVHTLVVKTAQFIEKEPDRARTLRRLATGALAEELELADAVRPVYGILIGHARTLLSNQVGEEFAHAEDATMTLLGKVSTFDYLRGAYLASAATQIPILSKITGMLGKSHPTVLTLSEHLATTLAAGGDLGRARLLSEHVLEIKIVELGKHHPDTLATLTEVAMIMTKQGECLAARDMLGPALVILTETLGKHAEKTLAAASALASVQFSLGEFSLARGSFEEIEKLSTTHGMTKGEVTSETGSLASVLHEEGDFDASRKLKERVLEQRKLRLNDAHPSVIQAQVNLAVTLGSQGNHDDALLLLEPAARASEQILGLEHWQTLWAKSVLGFEYYSSGRYGEARALQEKVREGRLHTLGPDHIDTFKVSLNLAGTLQAERHFDRARKLLEEILPRSEAVLGTRHPVTDSIFSVLGELLLEQGDFGALAMLLKHSGHRPTAKEFAQVRVGRNQPCPCGSKKKFKRCCGR